jgi:hypothetical protein
MPSNESSGVSKRTLALVIWTVVAITVDVGHFTFNPPTEGDFLNTTSLINAFLFFVWLVGLVVILVAFDLVGWFVERRELRAITTERRKEPRRF